MMKKRPQDQPAAEHDEAQSGERRNESGDNGDAKVATASPEHRDHEQERRHHQVLKQQNGEDCPTACGPKLLGLGENRNDDRGRRQRQRQTKHGRRHRRLVEHQRQGAKRRRRAEDLQRAEAENEAAHERQTLPRQFKTDHEQQKDDAKLGHWRDLLDILQCEGREPDDPLREGTEPIRAEQNARAEKAQNRTYFQAVE